jgi:hypothetical protein
MYGKKMANGGMATKAAKAEVKKHEQRMHKGKKPMMMADGGKVGGCMPGTTGTGRRVAMDGKK